MAPSDEQATAHVAVALSAERLKPYLAAPVLGIGMTILAECCRSSRVRTSLALAVGCGSCGVPRRPVGSWWS